MKEQDTNNSNDTSTTETTEVGGRHPRKRGGRWMLALALFAAGGISGGLATSAMNVYAHGDMRAMWSHGKHGGEVYSVERARERAADTAAFIIGAVDGSKEQKEAVSSIMTATVDNVYPLVTQHRDNRRDLIELLARPQLDEQALEALRQSELRLIDQASANLTAALGKTSKVLSAEQRQQLLSMAARMRRH